MSRQKMDEYLNKMLEQYPVLQDERTPILDAYLTLEKCYRNGGKLLVAGNGGSCCDAQHIVAELMKGFKLPRSLQNEKKRRLMREDERRGGLLAMKLQGALPAISLDGHTALNTAFANDVDPCLCYAQQVNAYGQPGDVFLGITTSGKSENILYAAVAARAADMKVIGLTGADGGLMKGLADVLVRVPRCETDQIQELHLPICHCMCRMLEETFFSGERI